MDLLSANELEFEYRELLQKPGANGDVQATPLAVEGIYIAVNDSGDYLCLVDDRRVLSDPPRRLKAISVDFGIKYKATISGVEISGRYTVLKLGSQNGHLLLSFCTLLAMLTSTLGIAPSPTQLQRFVEEFIELFAPRNGDPRERIKGLFGELAVIDYSTDRELFAASWHAQVNSNKDFSLPTAYLEVKTTEGKVRKHEFSSKQLESPFEGKQVLVASVLIEEDPQGQSVFQLLNSLQGKLTYESQTKLIKQVFESVGLDADDAHELKWVVQGNREGIWLYSAINLPRPQIQENNKFQASISGISFSINFEILEAAGQAHILLDQISEIDLVGSDKTF